MTLLRAKFVKKQCYLGLTLLYLSKKRPKTNMKFF